MPYPSLDELVAELPLPADMPPCTLALADDEGNTLDLHENGKNAPGGIAHLRELHAAVKSAPEHPAFFACAFGCCAALSLKMLPPGHAAPLPASAKNAHPHPIRPFLAASCRPKDAKKSSLTLLQTLLAAVSRLGRGRFVEQALMERVRFAENVVRSMSSGFLVLTPDLRVAHANPAAAALLQTSEEGLVGAKLTDYILSDLKVRKVFRTGKPIIDEEVFIKLAGKTVHILKTAVPVFDDAGEVIAVLDHFREIKEARQLVSRMSGTRASFSFDDIIYSSPAMGEAVELARMAANSTLSVLIHGESGTGKELFAHAIHQAGSRNAAPFVVIDCASMPRELVESELFGYVEGAFTGARRGGRPGKFELANGGTIFLDELGELPLELQSRLLRVLQNREVVRLGGAEPLPVDIRVIAATNRDLAEEVKQGSFRADLFHRLNVLAIHIPPLRSRPQDILTLAAYFLRKYRERFKRPDLTLSPEVLAALESRSWPGNARELENTIARAVQLCRRHIEIEHARPNAAPYRETPPVPTAPALSLGEIERKAFQDAVAACDGNIARAARALGVARSTVYKKLRAG